MTLYEHRELETIARDVAHVRRLLSNARASADTRVSNDDDFDPNRYAAGFGLVDGAAEAALICLGRVQDTLTDLLEEAEVVA